MLLGMSVLGHESQQEVFHRLIARGALSHAYLFAGPDGIGKRMVAEDVASATGGRAEIMRLGAERDEQGKRRAPSIERIREVRSWLSLRPFGGSKVVILDDADLLGHEAANALLKVLEEPPSYAHLFLVTARPLHVLPTVRSRCERVDFHALPEETVRRVLREHVIDDDDRALLAAVAAGRPGYALRLIQEQRISEIAKAIDGLEKALKMGIAERLVYAKTLADDDHASDVVAWWLAWVHAKLAERPRLASIAKELLTLSDAVQESAYNRRLAFDRFFLAIH